MPNSSCPARPATRSPTTAGPICARSPERDLFLLYFERDGERNAIVRGALPAATYRPSWFDPREGIWQAPGKPITVQPSSLLHLPERPDDRDWGLMLELVT